MEKLNQKANGTLILGIISLIAWVIPLFGYPVSIVGIVMGVKALKSEKSTFAKVGLILSCIGLLACLVNSVMGVVLFLEEVLAVLA